MRGFLGALSTGRSSAGTRTRLLTVTLPSDAAVVVQVSSIVVSPSSVVCGSGSGRRASRIGWSQPSCGSRNVMALRPLLRQFAVR
jgi:hypothetical protein